MRNLVRHSNSTFWLGVFILFNLLIGLLVLKDFGESWDEENFFQYARESLSAYKAILGGAPALPYSDPTLRHYGAWFWIVCVLAGRLFPRFYISDVAHYLIFLTFQAGVWGMYALAKRWLKPWTALSVALLFATQPLLWGHAFINERDIPCLSGFVLTMYLGLRWTDSCLSLLPAATASKKRQIDAGAEWRSRSLLLRLMLILLWIGGGVALAAWVWQQVHLWLARAPLQADPTFVHDVDLYLRPILARFWGGVLFLVLWLLWLGLTGLPFFPRLRAQLWQSEVQPYLRQTALLLRSPLFWAASIALGLTAGIRISGWLAGALVAWRLWRARRQAALWPLMLYGSIAFIVMYLSWPYLWKEPVLRLLITFRLMTKFPWPGKVLFQGQYYAGNELPRFYLPTLMALQVTEPVLVLSLIGLFVLLRRVRRERSHAEFGEMTLLWLGLPLLLLMLGKSYLYDNFRQFLFLLPPLFLWAGLGLQRLADALPRWMQVGVVAAMLIPGILNIVLLHPYPYIYYNSLVGGVAGAFRRYEMDYWGTSFRAAAAYLNRYAPPNARVVVWGPPTTFWRYAREDIRVYNALEANRPERDFYALISTRSDNDLTVYPELPVLFQVEKAGAVLAVVRYIPP